MTVVNVDQIRALGAFLRTRAKAARQTGSRCPALLAIVEDIQRRHAGFSPKYAGLAATLRPMGKPFGLSLPDNDFDGHALISRKLDDVKGGYAIPLMDTLLHHYWETHREVMLEALGTLEEHGPATAPFLNAARQTDVPDAIANMHEAARRSRIPRRSYGAKDWEIAAHRVAKERSAKTGMLTFARLEIDALPEGVLDMDWLKNLDCCSTLITHLPAMDRLRQLQTLDCSYAPLQELPSLRGCEGLLAVWCGVTDISSLEPLSHCKSLKVLYCGRTLVADLSPLWSCEQLVDFHCEETNVEELSGLDRCANLQTFDCQDTEVEDLAPLQGATRLQTLILNGCKIAQRTDAVWSLPSLKEVFLYRGELAGVPTERLSRSYGDNCLQRIRSSLGIRAR